MGKMMLHKFDILKLSVPDIRINTSCPIIKDRVLNYASISNSDQKPNKKILITLILDKNNKKSILCQITQTNCTLRDKRLGMQSIIFVGDVLFLMPID